MPADGATPPNSFRITGTASLHPHTPCDDNNMYSKNIIMTCESPAAVPPPRVLVYQTVNHHYHADKGHSKRPLHGLFRSVREQATRPTAASLSSFNKSLAQCCAPTIKAQPVQHVHQDNRKRQRASRWGEASTINPRIGTVRRLLTFVDDDASPSTTTTSLSDDDSATTTEEEEDGGDAADNVDKPLGTEFSTPPRIPAPATIVTPKFIPCDEMNYPHSNHDRNQDKTSKLSLAWSDATTPVSMTDAVWHSMPRFPGPVPPKGESHYKFGKRYVEWEKLRDECLSRGNPAPAPPTRSQPFSHKSDYKQRKALLEYWKQRSHHFEYRVRHRLWEVPILAT